MATPENFTASRAERVLATMVATVVALSILCFFAIVLAGPIGYTLEGTFGYFIIAIPLVGLPIGFLMLIALIIISAARRRRGEEPDS